MQVSGGKFQKDWRLEFKRNTSIKQNVFTSQAWIEANRIDILIRNLVNFINQYNLSAS